MKIVKGLIQGTYEWLKFRESHCGASNSAAILGVNQYQSAMDVWEDKTNRSFPESMNENMRAGVNAEPGIRAKWEFQTGKTYDTPTAEHNDYSFLSASFDGYCHEDGSIIEIKASRYPKLANCIKRQDVEYFKEIYPHYHVQCQHLMLISDAQECPVVTISLEGELLSITIPRDNEFIDKVLLPELIAFWNSYVLADVEPPLQKKDILYIDDDSAIKEAEELIALGETIKSLQECEKDLKKRIADRGDDGNFQVGSILVVTRINRKGSVDTKKLYESYNITENVLKKFRKSEIGFWQFKAI
jgi:putative phage-type endonuclease